jgi:ABC-type phosphate transport system substrate-binding protein
MTKRILFLLVAALLATCLPFLVYPVIADGEVDIIVNKSNPVADLSIADARKIFVGDKSVWPNGKRVTILMPASGQSERTVVLRDIYKLKEDDYNKYFMRAAFAGTIAAPPKDVGSAAQMKQLVAENVGPSVMSKRRTRTIP